MAQSIVSTQFQLFLIGLVFAFLAFLYFKVFGWNLKSFSVGVVLVMIAGIAGFVYMVWGAASKDDSEENK